MKRYLVWGIVLLCCSLGLAACRPDEIDLPATIDALSATKVALEGENATLDALLRQPTATPLPPPSATPSREPVVVLPTPQSVATMQQPPTKTPSPSATPIPSPTATATPIPDASVGDQPANLRGGPAVGYLILAEVPAGTPLDLLGKSADGEWLKVRIPDGTEGWMFYLPLRINISLDTIPVTE